MTVDSRCILAGAGRFLPAGHVLVSADDSLSRSGMRAAGSGGTSGASPIIVPGTAIAQGR